MFCFVFLGNDVAEKLAVVGFGANMITYLTKELNMPLTQAANTLTNFSGTASLTPLLGAFIADAFAGKFWTLTGASIIYQIVKTFTLKPLLTNFAWALQLRLFLDLNPVLQTQFEAKFYTYSTIQYKSYDIIVKLHRLISLIFKTVSFYIALNYYLVHEILIRFFLMPT